MRKMEELDAYSGIISNGEILSQEPLFSNNESEEEGDVDDIIVLHMDIRHPLSTLRTILEQRVGVPLKEYEFWLQNAQMLECHKNLVDQCVQGEGIVQINVQVITLTQRINIVDVLKPTDDVIESVKEVPNQEAEDLNTTDNIIEENYEPEEDKHVVKWVADKRFKNDQQRLGIPNNPTEWTTPMVRHWLQWAVRQFNLSQIKLQDWNITGKELANITIEEFYKKVPNDPGHIFWTHLELLRKCKMVAVMQKNDTLRRMDSPEPSSIRKHVKSEKNANKSYQQIEEMLADGTTKTTYDYPCGNRTGNNGQIQLWQFLLEILTDRNFRHIIHWLDHNGEFKLSDPERVAQLWGERKNKPTMNYEKLSRALRYYYDGDMISKVHGKRFVYQFVCDLRQLIGYSAEELAKLVNGKPIDSDINALGLNEIS